MSDVTLWCTRPPTAAEYARLLHEGLKHCASGRFVRRKQMDFTPQAQAFVDKLAHLLLDEKPVVLANKQPATSYRFAYTEETVERLLEGPVGLFDWLQPDWPEDLALISRDGRAWLYTSAHERHGCLFVPAEQQADLLTRFFGLLQPLKP
jgi:hypothetical protein